MLVREDDTGLLYVLKFIHNSEVHHDSEHITIPVSRMYTNIKSPFPRQLKWKEH